jgi:hypothetical protein
MSDNLLARLDPAHEPLFALLFQHVDDEMLTEISRADFGYDADIHLEALRRIREGAIPVPMPWNPGQVLGLKQWTELDDSTSKDIQIGIRGHWIRLFACTVLIRASIELQDYEYKTEDWAYLDEDETIVQFLDSALYLGDDVSLAALQFLGWRMQYQIQCALLDEDMGNGPCSAVAMLLLCVSLSRCDPEVVSFLIAVAHTNDEYIPISKILNESLRSQKWKETIHRMLLDPTAPQYTRSNPELRRFGMELIGHSIAAREL